MTTWKVSAMYLGAGSPRKTGEPQPVTRATMDSVGVCGTSSVTARATVDADTEEEAIKEAQPLLAWAARMFGMVGEPELSAQDADEAAAEFAALLASLPEPTENPEPPTPGARRYALM